MKLEKVGNAGIHSHDWKTFWYSLQINDLILFFQQTTHRIRIKVKLKVKMQYKSSVFKGKRLKKKKNQKCNFLFLWKNPGCELDELNQNLWVNQLNLRRSGYTYVCNALFFALIRLCSCILSSINKAHFSWPCSWKQKTVLICQGM